MGISIKRIRMGKTITSYSNKIKADPKAIELIKKLQDELNLEIPNEEKAFILKPLLDYAKIEKEDVDKIKILNILKSYFDIDNHNFYYIEMLINHIKRAIKKRKLKIENPLLESVKNIYRNEFEKAENIARNQQRI